MPKKYVIENSKVTAARLKKAAAKEAEEIRKQKELEDACWKEDDKLILRKEQRKREREEKRQKAFDKKQNNKKLLEKEMSSVEKCGKIKVDVKLTRAQIQSNTTQIKKQKSAGATKSPLTENMNKLSHKEIEARSVSEAIDLLNEKSEEMDKNPEKRVKAAYYAFEEIRLKQLKAEDASLRHSQLKEIVFKEWQKSSLNPLNQIPLC